MLQKFKITTCAFILCLFGLTLMTVSPVFADDSIDFVECQQIKPNRTSYALMKEKKNCFRDLALSNHALIDGLVSRMLSLEPEGRGRDILSQDNILKAKFGVDQVHLDDQFKVCQKIKPKGKSYALMKEKKNCFRDIARESLLTIALVVTEIGEQIERAEASNPNNDSATGLEKFSKTDLGTSLQALGDYGITTEATAANITKSVGKALSNAGAWVGGMFGF
jgi:hypothetical protein